MSPTLVLEHVNFLLNQYVLMRGKHNCKSWYSFVKNCSLLHDYCYQPYNP